jgi:hypothetical protein
MVMLRWKVHLLLYRCTASGAELQSASCFFPTGPKPAFWAVQLEQDNLTTPLLISSAWSNPRPAGFQADETMHSILSKPYIDTCGFSANQKPAILYTKKSPF